MPGNVGLFVGGVQVVRPSVTTQINTSAMVPTGAGAQDVPGFIGAFDGGVPNVVQTFTSLAAAIAVLRGGQALSYLARIFSPGGGNSGPAKVYVVRAGAPTQATLASGSGLTFTSRDYGVHVNGIQVTVAVGITTPWAVTVTKAADNYSKTYNVGNALSVVAPATGTNKLTFDHVNRLATLSDAAGTLTLAYPAGNGVTLAQLVPWINARSGWSAVLATGADPSMPVEYMDNPAAGQTLTNGVATPVPASQGMAVYEINLTDAQVTAALTAGTVYAALTAAATAPLAGGTGNSQAALTTTANGDWATALGVMDTVDCAALFLASSAAAVQALGYQDCLTQRTILRKKYRIFYTGLAPAAGASEATNVAAAIANAPILAGPVVHAWNGTAGLNPLSGLTEQLGSLGTAAQLCGMACGCGPAQSLTNNAMSSYGLEYPNPSDADITALLLAGITPIATDPVTGAAVCVQAITTYQGGANVSWRTLVGLRVQDAICRLFNAVLTPFIGFPLDLTTGQLIRGAAAKGLDASVMTPQNPAGFLTPGYTNGAQTPAWSNLTVTTDGLQSWFLSVQAHPVCESDYIPVSVNLVPVAISL